MIHPVIHDAPVEQCGYWDPKVGRTGWAVVHPSNGAILAYADTKEEAAAYRDALNDLPRQLRAQGVEVR